MQIRPLFFVGIRTVGPVNRNKFLVGETRKRFAYFETVIELLIDKLVIALNELLSYLWEFFF